VERRGSRQASGIVLIREGSSSKKRGILEQQVLGD
jgi:hypothetical protein